MKLFLDQGLPRSTGSHLLKHGIPSVHAGDAGLANASDASILERSRKEGWIVATLDADFHALLVLSGATVPSVIRVRIEGLRAESMAKLLSSVLEVCAQDLKQGAVVSVTESGIRVRYLPLLR
jgi:predicted nuclease of predicted toxin-antitoxin system